MWGMSHVGVYNGILSDYLFRNERFNDNFCASHTSKFAPSGDMWKNYRN